MKHSWNEGKGECNDRGEQRTNLSNQEKKGLGKLKTPMGSGEIIVMKTVRQTTWL